MGIILIFLYFMSSWVFSHKTDPQNIRNKHIESSEPIDWTV